MGFNSGVAYALMRGVRYAVNKYSPSWLLFLDDDTIVMRGSVRAVLRSYEKLPEKIKRIIGAISLGSEGNYCRVYETRLGIFSGTLIKADIAMKTCCRYEFFMDQADHDLYFKIRRQGLLALQIRCKLVDHRLGTKTYVPILKRFVDYEPPWRYYYIVRNSTILLRERGPRYHSISATTDFLGSANIIKRWNQEVHKILRSRINARAS